MPLLRPTSRVTASSWLGFSVLLGVLAVLVGLLLLQRWARRREDAASAAAKESLLARAGEVLQRKAAALLPQQCASCSMLGAKLRCGRCKAVSYCNEECQRAHHTEHKATCASHAVHKAMRMVVDGRPRDALAFLGKTPTEPRSGIAGVNAALQLPDVPDARRRLEAVKRKALESTDTDVVVEWYLASGRCCMKEGNLKEALWQFDKARTKVGVVPTPSMAAVEGESAKVYNALGRREEALAAGSRCLAIRREAALSDLKSTAYKDGVMRACNNLAALMVADPEGVDDAVQLWEEALMHARDVKSLPVELATLTNLSNILDDSDDPKKRSRARKARRELAACHTKAGREPGDGSCRICLEPVETPAGGGGDGPPLRVLVTSCGHAFHKRCLDGWLARTPECPACRQRQTLV